MTKLCCFVFAVALSVGGCVDGDVPPPPTGEDGEQVDDDLTPRDPIAGVPDPDGQCARYDSKGDGPCGP